MSRSTGTRQLETSLDVAAITQYMRTIMHEHITGYNALDTDGLVSAAYSEIECKKLVGAAPTAYLIAVGNIEHEHRNSR